jgi:hypothetical protein
MFSTDSNWPLSRLVLLSLLCRLIRVYQRDCLFACPKAESASPPSLGHPKSGQGGGGAGQEQVSAVIASELE